MNNRLREKARETNKRIHSLRSLRTAYTLLVLLILVSAGLITASVYIILYTLDLGNRRDNPFKRRSYQTDVVKVVGEILAVSVAQH